MRERDAAVRNEGGAKEGDLHSGGAVGPGKGGAATRERWRGQKKKSGGEGRRRRCGGGPEARRV